MNTKQETADSMMQASSILGIERETVRTAKAEGCTAFRHGRIDLRVLRSFLKRKQAKEDALAEVQEWREQLRIGWKRANPSATAQPTATELLSFHRSRIKSNPTPFTK